MEKYERDGCVAVLYSPEFGAGWSTWAGEHKPILMFDKEIVQAVLDGDKEKAATLAQEKCGGDYVCVIGAPDLEVSWVPKGQPFEITEYDGAESIRMIGNDSFEVA